MDVDSGAATWLALLAAVWDLNENVCSNAAAAWPPANLSMHVY